MPTIMRSSIQSYALAAETVSNAARCSAISEMDEVSVVNRERCIGCGLCVTGCPNDVARLVRKPEAERIQPPEDFAAWEHERLVNRGLTEIEF